MRAQLVNPRKVYCVDTGLVSAVSRRIVFNDALRFENMVFLALRRQYRDMYYFDEDGECDFVCMESHLPRRAVQACVELTKDDYDREIGGMRAAMRRFSFAEGFVVTKSQRDEIKADEGMIHVLPFSEFAR